MVLTSRRSAVRVAEPTMPIDMALCLSKKDFYMALSPSCESALRFERSCRSEQGEASERFAHRDPKKTKKQVTFADHRGLALTRVKVFSEFNDPIDIPANIQQMLNTALSFTAEPDKLTLDFTQPSTDYLLFRQSLERNLVCLEHCILKERAFAGTVKVKNVSFEKRVWLRVTFDSWRTHADTECIYVRDAFPSSYSDTFSFEVPLPADLPPHQRVEFAVCYAVAGREHWDSNHGNNYNIVRSSAKASQHHVGGRRSESNDFGIHFDRYGSPTCSHGLFPDWPSYAGYENIGPYY
ncbi:protein phosphatase 1 regulatory subunit 3B [Gouania willdenowi]|uniref:Protein phosphatase 1 regulatory subunit n=1 Tax=Gouania willdenowi TaxID=441366 RepID=A0A8C5DPM8_GOUWI|nr:protein phosphatase 1 regulatory subunit 3B [Gouania willdenowi]